MKIRRHARMDEHLLAQFFLLNSLLVASMLNEAWGMQPATLQRLRRTRARCPCCGKFSTTER